MINTRIMKEGFLMGLIKKWNSMSLILRILIGLVIGAILGFAVPKATWIGVPGELFVGALKAIAPILVFVLVASSLANSKGGNMEKFRTVIILYLFSTLCAAIVSVFTSFAFKVTIPLTGLDAVDASAAPQGMADVVMNLLKSIVVNPVGALANANASTDEFVAGRQLIMTSSSSSIASLLGRIGEAFELGVSGYPRVNENAAAGATVSGSCLVMFDHGEARRAAAWALTGYLTSADVQADFARGTGYLPANAAAAESEAWQALIAEYPQYQVGLEQLMATPDTMRSVTVGPSADFYYAIMNDISDMLDSDLSVEETVEILGDDLNGMLEQYLRANP